MIIRNYDGFVDKVYNSQNNLVEEMEKEIEKLLLEFGQSYDLEANPDQELEDCKKSIMNLIFETKYEW